MQFNAPIIETIRKRRSWRTFDSRRVGDDIIKVLLDEQVESHGPMGSAVRIGTVHSEFDGPRNLGTYGTINGASTFLMGAAENTPTAPEDFGYVFEKIILKATEMELGTCWMGGTFSRSDFTKQMKLQADETLMAVTPLGYMKEKRGRADTITVAIAQSHRRLPWNRLFYDGDFNSALDPEDAGEFEIPLEMVRIGPSASNKQPWRVIRAEGAFHFFLKRNPAYSKMIEIGGLPDLQRLDVGIAMAHFELSAAELGLSGTWSLANPEITNRGTAEYIATWG